MKTSAERNAAVSVRPRHEFFQLRKELLPSGAGAAKSLLLIRPEARLLHPQQRSRAGWRERKRHHALQIEGRIRRKSFGARSRSRI